MGAIGAYLRGHPWQRRALTVLSAVAAGAVAAMFAYPHVSRYLLLADLASPEGAVRRAAVPRAEALARRSESFRDLLERALGSEDDLRFAGAATVLRRVGRFDVPSRRGDQLDRMWRIDLAEARADTAPDSPRIRRMILSEIILGGRDNPSVRRALEESVRDADAAVREPAALLAARLGDDATLRTMLADADPRVAAGAALDAGIASRTALAEPILRMLASAGDVERTSAAAYALARMKAATGEDPLQRLPAVAGAGNQADLRDRLLHVAAVRADASAAEAIWAVIEADRSAGRTPPAMAILAAGKLRLARAAPVVKQLLGDLAAGRGEFTEGQVLALLDAADRLAVPVRAEVFALVERLWNPREHQLVLVRSARLLGRQAVLPQPPGQPAPPTEDCIRLLRQAALYAAAPATRPAGEEQVRTTPVPSAAAAAALWLMRPAESMYKPPPAGTQPAGVWEIDLASAAYYVRQAAGARTTLPGDYLAWHLGRSGRPEALGLGRQMLPPPPDPNVPLSLQPPREYAENERAAGAMLLALAQHGSRQDAARARELIASRLEGGVFGPEDDFFTAGAYRCALLILGRQDQAATVRELLGTKDFPQRRAFTALAAAGKRGATDWLLWNPQIGREDIAFLLIGKGLAEVLAAAAPDLPTVDECAGTDLLHWQVRILQDEYAIRRGRLAIGLSSPGGPAEASRPARGEPTP